MLESDVNFKFSEINTSGLWCKHIFMLLGMLRSRWTFATCAHFYVKDWYEENLQMKVYDWTMKVMSGWLWLEASCITF